MKINIIATLMLCAFFLNVSSFMVEASEDLTIYDRYLHVYNLVEANADRFYQMGVELCMEDTLLSVMDPQNFLSNLFSARNVSEIDSAEPIADFFDSYCEHRGGYYIDGVFYDEALRIDMPEPAHLIMVPFITWIQNSEATITEADIDFLLNFLYESRWEFGVHIFINYCFVQAMENQGMLAYFNNQLNTMVSPEPIEHAQKYENITPRNEHFRIAGSFSRIGETRYSRSITFYRNDFLSYNFSLDRNNNTALGIHCLDTGHYLVISAHHYTMSGRGTFIVPFMIGGRFFIFNGGPWASLLFAANFTLYLMI